jgi:hypothetical protein
MVLMSAVMAVDTAATCRSPSRSWTAVWVRFRRKKMAPKMRAEEREEEARAAMAGVR